MLAPLYSLRSAPVTLSEELRFPTQFAVSSLRVHEYQPKALESVCLSTSSALPAVLQSQPGS